MGYKSKTTPPPASRRFTRNDTRAALVLQQWVRRQSARSLQQAAINATDYITLEPPREPVFYHVCESNHVTAFDARALAHYICATGNLHHPHSRVEFNDTELRRLTHLCRSNGIDCINLVAKRAELERRRTQQIESANLLGYLENNISRAVEHALNACLNASCTGIGGAYFNVQFMVQTNGLIIDENILLFLIAAPPLTVAAYLRTLFASACEMYRHTHGFNRIACEAIVFYLKMRVFQVQNSLPLAPVLIEDMPVFIDYYNQLYPNAASAYVSPNPLAVCTTDPPPPPGIMPLRVAVASLPTNELVRENVVVGNPPIANEDEAALWTPLLATANDV